MNEEPMSLEPAESPEALRVLHRAAEQNPRAIFVTDRAGTIVYANPAARQATGHLPGDAIGKASHSPGSKPALSDNGAGLQAALRAGTEWEGALPAIGEDGGNDDRHMAHVRVTPIRNAAGDVSHYFAIQVQPVGRHPEAGRSEHVGTPDQLTGLPGRSQFMSRLAESMSDATRVGVGLALAVVDLDDFKSFNDSFGQQGADRLLVAVAQRLQDIVRRDDLLARLGGDRFGLLLWDAQPDTPNHELLRRIQATISQPLNLPGESSVTITACAGVALYPRDGASTDAMLQAAEAALGLAKKTGHGEVRISEPALAPGGMTRIDLASQLRQAVDRAELVLHFQPKVSLHSGEIIGAEALVRWRHPAKGMIPPGEFIPFAEESGLIVPISEWVLRAACRQAVEWRRAGLRPIKVGVNISARHFRHADLPDVVAAVLAETGMDSRLLDLELTESAMMHDTAAAIRIADRLRALGASLSLDDFGTGYSSLAYLSRFAFDQIKIDQSFIRDVTSNPVNGSIVAATIAMAHKLGKSVIAEGVETEAQMSFLCRHGCDEMQGYFFSRPLAATDFSALLAAGRRMPLATPAAGEAVPTLLLVDDEPSILNALKRVFRNEGYRLLMAGSGQEGLELLALHRVQVIVSDQRMPEMGGVEFLSRAKELYPDSVRIVLSGYAEVGMVTEAVNRGAISKYFTKPWDDDQLRAEIRRAFRSMAGAATVDGNGHSN
ncbi:MAG: EAL domain-containing protein [Gammaproteobacteria bacterium]|nr:EAL domain-containing protein [Gammaproteobacteria bacterium]MBU1646094.1 EAL domain-containing protein [Gammaproteobacteria bacterium]MBU1972156.1 EAL domain-containing protein [Gammaproteobacteria bacterium]